MTEQQIEQLKRTFLANFAVSLGRNTEPLRGCLNAKPGLVYPVSSQVCFRRGERDHGRPVLEYAAVHIRTYAGGDHSCQPWVLRIAVNEFPACPSQASLHRMLGPPPSGWTKAAWLRSVRMETDDSWSLELSVLPDELLDFAPWLVQLIVAVEDDDGRNLGATPHPVPGIVPGVLPGGSVMYYWSQAAETTYDGWRKKDEERRERRRVLREQRAQAVSGE